MTAHPCAIAGNVLRAAGLHLNPIDHIADIAHKPVHQIMTVIVSGYRYLAEPERKDLLKPPS